MKTCTKCLSSKEESEFSPRSDTGGIVSACKLCACERQKTYYQKHREEKLSYNRSYYKDNREKFMEKNVKNRGKKSAARKARIYGLSIEDLQRILSAQDGVCAICKTVGGKNGLGVDHDHETGKVRALLCSNCNAAIGLLRDSSALAQEALAYLKLHGR